ncbi:MAG: molybdopterin-dependent oxidoreductase, partial [Rubrobacteridae bacterium]|nr:molybdopterin-dependent oxidoreductase [Rubrobacteridae bacterium]
MHDEKQKIITTCTMDCPDNCGITAHVSCDKVVALAGIREHEITGLLLCRKSSKFIERVYSKERVLKPLKKVDGQWAEVSWDDALDEIAGKIKEVIEKYGSTAILHYQSAGSLAALKMLNKRFFNLLGGVTEASGSLCGGAATKGQTLDFGKRACHDPLDHRNSRLIILWGRNPVETNLHLVPILKAAQSKGAKVVLIDPLATDTVKFSDKHIKPTPGMDGYLAIGIAKMILDSGKYNKAFVERYCNNFEGFKRLVNSYSIRQLSKLSGVPADEIKMLSEMYGQIKPAAIICGWGLQRYQWGAELFRLIDALGAITGNIGISGGGVSHAKDGFEFFDMDLKGKNFAKQTREIAKPLLAIELLKLNEPPINIAFINGANPVSQSPNATGVRQALSGIETMVVFEQFMTDTAQIADYVLPVTTFLEETDVVASYWHNMVGLVNRVIEPRGEARSDLQIYQALASRLGIEDKMRGTPEEWIEKAIAPLTFHKINIDTLKIHGHKRVPDAAMVPFENRKFETDSERMNLIQEFNAAHFTNRK